MAIELQDLVNITPISNHTSTLRTVGVGVDALTSLALPERSQLARVLGVLAPSLSVGSLMTTIMRIPSSHGPALTAFASANRYTWITAFFIFGNSAFFN